jgi:uncharacterized protein
MTALMPETRMAHDTDEYAAIHWANRILQTQVGSRLHGVVVPDQDDSDELGIVIEPPEYVIRPPDEQVGFKRFRQYERRTANRGERSGPDDKCLISYSLRKWLGMAAHGDPTILLPLFVPDNQITWIAWPGHDLRERRGMFMSTLIGARYLGYLDKQVACLKGEVPGKTNRPELVAVHGYDTKYAFHALRLAYQGFELAETRTLRLPITGAAHDILTQVRNGDVPLEDALALIDIVRSKLITAWTNSSLPDRPDYDAISQWLADTYIMWWEAR